MCEKPYTTAERLDQVARHLFKIMAAILACAGQGVAQDAVSPADLAMLSKAMQGEVVLDRNQREARIAKVNEDAEPRDSQILDLSLIFFSTRNDNPVNFDSQTKKGQSLLLQIATRDELPAKARQLAFNTIAISLDDSEDAKLFEKKLWELVPGFSESQLESFVLALSFSRWDASRPVRLAAVLNLVEIPQFTEKVQIALVKALGSAVFDERCRQIEALAVFDAMYKANKLSVGATKAMFEQFELWADKQNVLDTALRK